MKIKGELVIKNWKPSKAMCVFTEGGHKTPKDFYRNQAKMKLTPEAFDRIFNNFEVV